MTKPKGVFHVGVKYFFGQVCYIPSPLFQGPYLAPNSNDTLRELPPPQVSQNPYLRSKKKLLRQMLGIESGEEVKELMLGRNLLAPGFPIVCPSMLTREHHQNLVDLAENSLVSDHDVPGRHLCLMHLQETSISRTGSRKPPETSHNSNK